MLKHETDFGAHLVQIGLRIGHIDAVHPNFAALDAFKLVYRADQSRFAAARRPANHHHFALPNFQIDIIDHVQVFEEFIDVFEFNHVYFFQTALRTK